MATVLPGLLRVSTRSLWTTTPRALSCLAHLNHNNFAKINNNYKKNSGNFAAGKRCSSGIVKENHVPVMGSPEPRGTIFAVNWAWQGCAFCHQDLWAQLLSGQDLLFPLLLLLLSQRGWECGQNVLFKSASVNSGQRFSGPDCTCSILLCCSLQIDPMDLLMD